MKLLLDTCTFLWIITDSAELSSNAKLLFTEPDNEVYLSVVSLWEILVKNKIGRLPLPAPANEFVVEQRKLHCIESLALQEEAIVQLPRLPEYHKDPFDRMLICQAIANGLTIVTPDSDIKQYPLATVW